jgi:hypothetical protein
MFLSLNDFFSDESAAIQVDSSVIDVSEFSDEGDQAFLITQGHELLRIDAKADFAKEQICKAIDQKAGDAKGKIIYDIQERFKNSSELKGGLMKYFHSLGYWEPAMEKQRLEKPVNYKPLSTAFIWANAYRGALDMSEKLGKTMSPEQIQERINSIPQNTLAAAYTGLSSKDREELYKSDNVPTQSEIREKVKSPEAKLSKAEELLAAARVRKEEAEKRWEQVKKDPETKANSPEYCEASNELSSVSKSTENWEAKVTELQALVDAKEAELNKFKFDETLQRDTRIKVLTDALTVGVPQATADLNKYIRDAEYYPTDVRRHFDDQIKVLADMCGDYLSRI